MEKLISNKAVRFLRILEFTYLNKETTIESIMKLNSCSKNTARSDIEEIHQKWSNLLKTKITFTSITVSNIAMATLMDVKQEILSNEISIKLLINILLNPTYTINDHSMDLDYSESYLRKIVSKINTFLELSDSKISYHKFNDISYPVLLSDNEVKLHHHLANIVKAANAYDNFDHIKDYSPSHFEILCNKVNWPLTAFLEKDVDVLAKISHVRVQEGYTSDAVLRSIYLDVYSKFDFEVLINVFYDIYNSDALDRFGENTHRIFLHYFEKSQKVILSIIFKTLISSYNMNELLNRDYIFTQRFKQQANGAYSIMESIINKIDDELDYNLKDYIGELGYVAFNILPSLLTFKDFKIAIHSDLSLSHANTLLVFMETHFSSNNNELYNPNEDYDFVITTDANFKHNDAITVAVTDLPGQTDIDAIYTALYTLK